jgi:hypothetical protein
MKRILLAFFITLLCVGCTPGRAVFVDVVQDHRVVTVETIDAVKKSIQDEVDERWDDLSPDDRAAVQDLMDRLDLISKQSELIDEYVTGTVDDELLSELLRNRWKEGRQ